MTKEARKKEKAVKKIDRAVRKAVDKGVSQTAVEKTVQAAITKVSKKRVPKKAATASRGEKPSLKKLPGKTRPPTLTLKRGGNP
jgi:hypothetical protein